MKIVLITGLAAIIAGCGSTDSGTRSASDAAATTGSDGGAGSTGTDGADGGDCLYANDFNNQTCNPHCGQSTCKEGELCTLNGDQIGCFPAGTQALGKGCKSDTPCAEGICVIAEGKTVGKCRKFCGEDKDCDDPKYACVTSYAVSGGGTLKACGLKPSKCSVFEQNCDGEGQGCYLDGCLAAGAAAAGDDCSAPNDCKAGLLCISSKCQVICNPKSGGPNPKCHLKCPNNTATIQGNDEVAICAIEEDVESCNVAKQDCKDALQKCIYDPSKGGFCGAPGTSQVGEKCSQPEDCAVGLVCWASKCHTLCFTPGEATNDVCKDPFTPCAKLGPGVGYCDE